MIPWNVRPVEEANLLNPAFCSLNIASAVSGYTKQIDNSAPFALLFLVLPLVLHKSTRILLPRTIKTYLAPWIQKNYDLRINFADRVISLKPFTKEAIIFGCNTKLIQIKCDGSISPLFSPGFIKKVTNNLDKEASECIEKAFFVGRWISTSGSPETIMTLLGVKP